MSCVWRTERHGDCHLLRVLLLSHGPHYWPVTGDMTPQVAFHTKDYTHRDGTCVTVSQTRYATNTDIHAVTQRATRSKDDCVNLKYW